MPTHPVAQWPNMAFALSPFRRQLPQLHQLPPTPNVSANMCEHSQLCADGIAASLAPKPSAREERCATINFINFINFSSGEILFARKIALSQSSAERGGYRLPQPRCCTHILPGNGNTA
jgi:hypothetical protein